MESSVSSRPKNHFNAIYFSSYHHYPRPLHQIWRLFLVPGSSVLRPGSCPVVHSGIQAGTVVLGLDCRSVLKERISKIIEHYFM